MEKKDNRFAHVFTDPKFKNVPRRERKVKIDKRFQSMFKDPRFVVKSTVDKRGRPSTFATAENFKKFYQLSDSEESDATTEDEEATDKTEQQPQNKLPRSKKQAATAKEKTAESKKKKSKDQESSESSSEEQQEEAEVPAASELESAAVNQVVRNRLKDLSVDYARGEGQLLSDSSSSEEDSGTSDEGEEEEVEHAWGEMDKDADQTEEATARLAVCNLDWDRINSEDLMVLLSSFLPSGSAIQQIAVYPSEFGERCMREEEVKGPKELSEQTAKGGNEEGEDYDLEKLRQYEMRRLRYFYAIVTCDSTDTAEKIYNECDGLEFESSAARLDLRFVPDDTEFEQSPRDECSALPEPGKYRPQVQFSTGALGQARFELSWDCTDPRRAALSQRVWATKGELPEEELQAVLASSSEEEGEEEEADGDLAEKYRALLNEETLPEEALQVTWDKKKAGKSSKDSKKGDMEVTWEAGLAARTDQVLEERRRKKAGLGDKTPFEELMEKKRQKKKNKRLQKQQAADGGTEEAFSDDELPPELEGLRAEMEADEEKTSPSKKEKRRSKKKRDSDKLTMDPKERAELELLVMEGETEEKHFRVPRTGKQVIEDDFQVDVTDPRFSALYTSHLYNIDPADPHFRSSPATQALVQEKQRRRIKADQEQTPGKAIKAKPTAAAAAEPKRSMDPQLSSLVRNVKRRAQQINHGGKKKN